MVAEVQRVCGEEPTIGDSHFPYEIKPLIFKGLKSKVRPGGFLPNIGTPGCGKNYT